jgi:hypothetical protein
MPRSKGHWFCDHCDDVVFMSYEAVTQTNVPCPRCSYPACNFIPEKITRAMLPAVWFAAMRRAVDEATNPELPDMRNHKKLI